MDFAVLYAKAGKRLFLCGLKVQRIPQILQGPIIVECTRSSSLESQSFQKLHFFGGDIATERGIPKKFC
jgi:hypothetical protein